MPRSAIAKDQPERGPWLPGFGWAVPTAFSAAVSACRFEQGDVVYAERSAYDDWAEGPPGRWIQVLDPPRSARARSADGDAGRFGSSWVSPVTLDVGRDGAAAGSTCTTTQGRLFTCLWKDDLDALEASKAPPPPLLLAELQRSVEAAVPGMRAALLGGQRRAPVRTQAGRAGAGGRSQALLFMAGVDLASDASRAKAEAIWTALEAGHLLRVHDAPPAACGVPDGAAYHPSLVVRGIVIEAEDGGPVEEGRVTEALKAVLYKPSPSPHPGSTHAGPGSVKSGAATVGGTTSEAGEEDAPARADRFSLARHGWLGPLAGSATAELEAEDEPKPGAANKSKPKT